MVHVTDTHSLIWFLSEDKSLSNKTKEVFENTEKGNDIMVIPTIVMTELLFLCEKKNILNKFSEVIEKINSGTNYTVYNLDLEVIIECKNLAKISEMHDKIIVATEKILDAGIITKDKEIKEFSNLKVIW